MKTKDFSFDLPPELIAQEPRPVRGQSRLMILDPSAHQYHHASFVDFIENVPSHAILVFNDSRVRKARVFAFSEKGRKVETIFLQNEGPFRWQCLLKNSKRLQDGHTLEFPHGMMGRVEGSQGNVRWIHFDKPVTEEWIDKNGHIPLPPYIRRPETDEDAQRYQTVYAKNLGSVAAPTAGLHFTEQALQRLKARGVETASLTLHVGLGTFLPVRVENVEDHKMHTETYSILPETAERLTQAQREGRPIVAIGTTSLRTLESAWSENGFMPGDGKSDLFITPGYTFKAVDQLFTNFHTPESTLLMLVSAFAGWDFIRECYAEAIRARYMFFSYGDATWIRSRTDPRPL
ncbi:MAG: tRNA preQ1(34) S-adenosylmethionine ribosyltransferase-isomerase QueA [Spirochaetales bacterium]|nr:tRNA preQ1(34) S-adenosylmethionine ribosyltransferase-isomerase QueA [Spirochaetales bacterium]